MGSYGTKMASENQTIQIGDEGSFSRTVPAVLLEQFLLFSCHRCLRIRADIVPKNTLQRVLKLIALDLGSGQVDFFLRRNDDSSNCEVDKDLKFIAMALKIFTVSTMAGNLNFGNRNEVAGEGKKLERQGLSGSCLYTEAALQSFPDGSGEDVNWTPIVLCSTR